MLVARCMISLSETNLTASWPIDFTGWIVTFKNNFRL